MLSLNQKLIFPLIIVFFSSFSEFSQDDYLNGIFDQEWEYYLKQNPVFANSIGRTGYESSWKNLSLDSFRKRNEHSKDLLIKLKDINPYNLSEENQLNLRLFKQITKHDVASYKFNRHLLTFSHRGGIQLAHEVVERLSLENVGDYKQWLNRLRNLDVLIQQTITLAEEGLRGGYLAPKLLMLRVKRQINLQTQTNIEINPFYKVFKELPKHFTNEEKGQIQKEARRLIQDKIIPAYQDLYAFFLKEYLPSSRASFGVYDNPDGLEFYRSEVMSFTTTNLTPHEIHEIGLSEVKRIKGEMKKIISELNFEGSFQEFLTFLRTDKRFYYQTSEELFNGYLAVSKRIDPKLVKLFKTLPRTPYGVRKIPIESAPDTTTAYYMPPSPDGKRPGYYYVNLYRPETRPKYEMEVLSVHEAVPGHHLQISLAIEKEDMPMFRRLSPYTVFVEGWGLYSESLGYELGLYRDPYSRFGQLTYDMWRAVRLVVDTGIHYFKWDRRKAINFFKNNAGKSELDIINEIDRYIMWPGQALAYKIGQLKLIELRNKAEGILGIKFDIREFHDVILKQGALPLNEVEILVDDYINDNK